MAAEEVTTQAHGRLCKVCGALAGKHVYYGARTCISCRGFFRRSVQSNHYKFFCCTSQDPLVQASNSSSCLVNSKTRKNCKRCRFSKCLAVGMKVTWVLSEEERCKRMMQRSKVPKASITQETIFKVFSQGELDRAEMLYDVTMELYTRLTYHMFAADMEILRSSFFHSFNGRPFTFAEVKFFEAVDQYVVTELVFKMVKLHNITNTEDARLLAKHNVPRLVGLYQSLVCKVHSLPSLTGGL